MDLIVIRRRRLGKWPAESNCCERSAHFSLQISRTDVLRDLAVRPQRKTATANGKCGLSSQNFEKRANSNWDDAYLSRGLEPLAFEYSREPTVR